MDEKIFNGPEDLVNWFKENPDMLGPIPWGGNLIAHFENINVGCGCTKNARIGNVEQVYTNLVIKIFKENENFSLMLKGSTGAKKIKFYLKEELLAEI